MSDTITDMPKITQMLDAGWNVQLWKNGMGTYSAEAKHRRQFIVDRTKRKLIDSAPTETRQYVQDDLDECEDGLMTDDFTPEQALTRLAYKVHGEVI